MDLQQFLSEHAISDEIGRERYIPYQQGDADFVESFFESFGRKQKRFARTVSGQENGLVMRRKGWKQEIPPQLRPEKPVYGISPPMWSYHPTDRSKLYGYVQDKKGKWHRVQALAEKQRERHLRKWPDDHKVADLECVHLHRPKAKYAIPPGRSGKRLDVPDPDSVLRAERVFFVLEGCLKTDAIRSAGAAAFGVPSVSCWPAGGPGPGEKGPFAPELDDFISEMNLPAKEVVIVCDADWVANPMVILHAMMCRTYLREKGVDRAVVAAPSLTTTEREILKVLVASGSSLERANDDDRAAIARKLSVSEQRVTEALANVKAKKGVDDFLHAGYSLDELAVLEREGCDLETAWRIFSPHSRFTLASRLSGGDPRRRKNNVDALRKLPLYADENGQIFKSLKSLSRILHCARDTARRTIEDLEHVGLVEVEEGSLDASYGYTYEWETMPRLTVRPEFRVTDYFVPLGDWLATSEPTREKAVDLARA
jgi:predicted transcriptional regulator